MTNQLTTSLAEIRSYNPCASGWRDMLTARKPQCDDDYSIQFLLADCLEPNSISDVCWLIGKRKKEIQICVRFARMCADSVKDLDNYWGRKADADAAYAAYAADAAADADADAYAAAYAAYAAAYAADAAADANAADAAAYAAADEKQKQLNKQFLIQCINEFNQE